MRTRAATYLRFLAVFGVLSAIGIGTSVYVLIHERLALPFQNVYTVRVAFTAADGVLGGIGQPVNVVGVRVGQVTGVKLADGTALVSMQLQRDQVPRVYQNATATLEPITSLKDMQVDLNPGRPPARPLASGATIGVGQSSAPVPLSDLLSRLDTDTRTYLSSLIASLDQGTNGRATDMRRMLITLGPTIAQTGRISHALAKRDQALARLVHNLALVTRAASRDGQLAAVVSAGNQTLQALAEQDRPLREAIAKLPSTLSVTGSTLAQLQPFATKLGPTLTALLPAVRRLPAALRALGPFANTGIQTLKRDVRPLVRDAEPLTRTAAPAVENLNGATPDLTGAAQTLNYFLNELAYHPPGDGEGFLFWLDWAVHNLDSNLSTGDAHGALDRATVIATCNGLQEQQQLQQILGIVGLCPK